MWTFQNKLGIILVLFLQVVVKYQRRFKSKGGPKKKSE